MKIPLIAIHRGRNAKVSFFFRSVTDVDYNFDFRGVWGGSRLNPMWLLIKAWITSREIPEAKAYLIEGGMLFWVGWFLKRRYPQARLLLKVPEPAFWLSPEKGTLQRFFYRFRMRCMKKSVDWLFPVSHMVAEDAIREMGFPAENIGVVPHYVTVPERFPPLRTAHRKNTIVFVVDRPNDAGFVKGLDIAVEACRALHQRRSDIRLLLAGAGTQYLQYDEHWIECLGHVPIEKVFERSALCIAPARYDAFPLAVAEAGLSGTIPLVSKFVGQKECLREVPYPLVVDTLSHEAWADRMEKLLLMEETELDAVKASLVRAFSGLTRERCFARFLDEMQKAVDTLCLDITIPTRLTHE